MEIGNSINAGREGGRDTRVYFLDDDTRKSSRRVSRPACVSYLIDKCIGCDVHCGVSVNDDDRPIIGNAANSLHPLIIGRYNDVAEPDTAQRFRDDIPSREYRRSRFVLIVWNVLRAENNVSVKKSEFFFSFFGETKRRLMWYIIILYFYIPRNIIESFIYIFI